MIHIVDIGSLELPDGSVPYKPLLDAGLGQLTTVDPQDGEFIAIADGKPATLHVCAYPGWTSLLRPNLEVLKQLPPSKAWRIRRELPIQTYRLDSLDIPDIDYLKIDVQGSELMVLQYGRHKLRNCALVHIELAFVPLYEEQPLYWQIDAELRAQGFHFRTFVDTRSCRGQLLEIDAVYVRPEAEATQTILNHCYPIAKLEKAA